MILPKKSARFWDHALPAPHLSFEHVRAKRKARRSKRQGLAEAAAGVQVAVVFAALHGDAVEPAQERRYLSNPYLLIRPLQRKEAIASSNIEGTYTRNYCRLNLGQKIARETLIL